MVVATSKIRLSHESTDNDTPYSSTPCIKRAHVSPTHVCIGKYPKTRSTYEITDSLKILLAAVTQATKLTLWRAYP